MSVYTAIRRVAEGEAHDSFEIELDSIYMGIEQRTSVAGACIALQCVGSDRAMEMDRLRLRVEKMEDARDEQCSKL